MRSAWQCHDVPALMLAVALTLICIGTLSSLTDTACYPAQRHALVRCEERCAFAPCPVRARAHREVTLPVRRHRDVSAAWVPNPGEFPPGTALADDELSWSCSVCANRAEAAPQRHSALHAALHTAWHSDSERALAGAGAPGIMGSVPAAAPLDMWASDSAPAAAGAAGAESEDAGAAAAPPPSDAPFRIVVANEFGTPSSTLPSHLTNEEPQFFKMELTGGTGADALFDLEAMTQPQRHGSCDLVGVTRQHTLDECIQVRCSP